MGTVIMCGVGVTGFTRIQLETSVVFLFCFLFHTLERVLSVCHAKSEHHGLFGSGLWSSFEGNTAA